MSTNFDLEAQHSCETISRTPTIVHEALSEKISASISPTLVEQEQEHEHEWPAWHGYIAIVAGVCQQILCWGMIMTFGTILAFYSKHLMPGRSQKELSLIGAIPPFCLLSLAMLWGRLLDAGHHRTLNTVAGSCITVGFVGMMFTGGRGGRGDGKYWAILLAATITGVGQSIYFLSAPHMAKTWFPKHKGLAMGFTNSGAAIGGAIFPIAFTRMVEMYSFRTAVGLLAGISGLMACFIWWASVPAPSFRRRCLGKKGAIYTWWPRRAFRSWTFRVHVAAMCIIYLGILIVPFYIEMWAATHRVGTSEDSQQGTGINHERHWLTVYLVVILNACQLPGRWLGSTACDYISARKIHATAALGMGILILPSWLHIHTYVSGTIFAGLFGVLLGVMVSLPVNDVQEILGTRTHLFGQYSGVVYTCASPFILSGAIIGASLVGSKTTGYYEAGVFAASVMIVGGLLIVVSLLIPNDTWKFDDGAMEE